MRSDPVGLDVWFMYANSEGSGETERMRRLAWAFAGRLCDKNQNLMSWLIYLWYYSEFLPAYLSSATMEKYGLTTPTESYSYDPTIDPSILSPFAIAFR